MGRLPLSCQGEAAQAPQAPVAGHRLPLVPGHQGWKVKVWNLPPKLRQFVAPHGLHPGQTPSNGADKAESSQITGN
jgi:hypothetical protein